MLAMSYPNVLQGVSKVFDQLWHNMAFLIFGAQTYGKPVCEAIYI